MKLASCVIGIFALLLSSSCASSNVEPLFPCSPYLDEPYGMVTHITRTGERWDYNIRNKELELLNRIGCNFVRADLDYSLFSNDRYNKNELLDSVLASCRQYNIKFLGIVKNVEFGKYNWNHANEYKKYLSNLKKYKNQIQYWEYINEADLIKDSLIIDGYSSTLRSFWKMIKSNRTKNKVLFSGVANVRNPFFVKTISIKAQKYFDIMNLHSYSSPYKISSEFEIVASNMKQYGWKKPVWLTECGMSTYYESKTRLTSSQKDTIQAKRVAPLHLVSFAYGVNKIFWYNLKSYEQSSCNVEDHFGILHRDLSPKLSFYAYQTLITMCPNKSMRPTLEVDGDFYRASWFKPNGSKVLCLWTEGRKCMIPLNYFNAEKIVDYLGKEYSLNNKNICVSDAPLYIILK